MEKLTPEQKEMYESLSMNEKLAIFLTELGEDTTSKIFANLDIDLITEISVHIATVKKVDKPIATAVIEEFQALIQSNQYLVGGGLEYAKEILFKTFPADTAQIILNKLARDLGETKSFAYLNKVKPEQLAGFISQEHPQTIALIIAHMEPVRAAETLGFFEDDLRSEVTIRMANLGDISPSVIKRVSAILEKKLESLTSYKVEVGGPRAVAEVLNKLSQKASKSTIEKIEKEDQDLANTIKELMFTFEDIIKLDKNAIRELLKETDKNNLMIALKGATDELKQKFLENMSQRAAEAFEEELSFLGPVKVKDVEEAQRKIVDEIQRMVELGKIQIGDADEVIE
jgi:flagellar motor switch protein FliG